MDREDIGGGLVALSLGYTNAERHVRDETVIGVTKETMKMKRKKIARNPHIAPKKTRHERVTTK